MKKEKTCKNEKLNKRLKKVKKMNRRKIKNIQIMKGILKELEKNEKLKKQ